MVWGVIVILGLFCLNFLYKRTNAYKNVFIDIEKFEHLKNVVEGSLDMVVIGSNSPKYAFDFSDIKTFKCDNWCIGPETFEYDNIILRKFACKLRKGGTVILAVCPLNFFHHRFHPHSDLFKYYSILSKKEMPDYNCIEYLKYFKYPLLFNPKYAARIIWDVDKNRMMELEQNRYGTKDLNQNATFWIQRIWNPAYGIDIENMGPLSDVNRSDINGSIRSLRNIVEFCHSNGLRLLLVYMPVTKELNEKFSDEFVDNYIRKYVREAIAGYDVRIADYMRDKRFADSKYYIDAFFMNRMGAKYFTEIFINENID